MAAPAFLSIFPCQSVLYVAINSLSPPQRMQEDLQRLKCDLQQVSERCKSFLDKSPTGSSVPHLRSELGLLVDKMDHTCGLSFIYLDK